MVKKGKKIYQILALFITMFILSFVATFSADNQIGASIEIVKNSVTPEPVEPGNDLTLKVNIINSGDEWAENINIIPDVKSPFYYKNSDFTKKDFALCSDCSYDATYYLTVDSQTISGIYPINFKIKYGNGIVKDNTVLVKVVGVPDLVISYDKESFYYPEQIFDLNLNLENIGTGNAKNIKIISNSNNFALLGSQVRVVDGLDAKSNTQVSLKYKVNTGLKSGLYSIPIEISYQDEQGNILSKNYDISIYVGKKAQIDIQSLKVDKYQNNIFDPITISGIVENYGDGKAENVYAYIETDLEGYNKSFVGTLDAGEDSPIIFNLNSNKIGDYPIKLVIKYTDDRGEHTVTENFSVKVVKPTSRIYTVIGIVLLILLLIGFKLIRNKRK